MPLGREVGIGSGHIVLDGDPAAPRKGAQKSPTFAIYGRPYKSQPMCIVAKRLDGLRCHLVRR